MLICENFNPERNTMSHLTQVENRDCSRQRHNLILQYFFLYAVVNLIMRDLRRKRSADFLRVFSPRSSLAAMKF